MIRLDSLCKSASGRARETPLEIAADGQSDIFSSVPVFL
jgi:hypothetical protein